MNTKLRIASILEAICLNKSITGLSTFHLSQLKLPAQLDFPLPTNLRLGHLAEKVVSGSIKASTNFSVLYENIQVLEHNRTVGELDFIIEDLDQKKILHLELAYKFYLFDPRISTNDIENWIGPNRNDSLVDKLDKLKRKQFPLLYHSCTKSILEDIDLNEVTQALCLLVSLYIPYEYKGSLDSEYAQAIKGYYINFETFRSLDNSRQSYHIPSRKEWGMDPSENTNWSNFDSIHSSVSISIEEQQTILVWQKEENSYSQFFVTFW